MTAGELIQNIPKFECSDGRNLSFSNDFMREKLYNALMNRNIICLARGEGRSSVLNDIMFHPEILFDWGEKSVHAFLANKQERFSLFCDPDEVDKEVMIYFIRKYGTKLKEYYVKYKSFRCSKQEVNDFLERLIDDIDRGYDRKKLLCIKEWLIYALHTMGEGEFKNITPCVSCSYGDKRFDVAQSFGKGRYGNKYYVVMDSWVYVGEEGVSYKRTEYVNEILGEYGLEWFSNKHNEIMVKYAIFPQQLVGYYFWDRGVLQKYVINKHYVDTWEDNPKFEIGEPIYFEQIIDFEKLGPYNTVYGYNGGEFWISSRRK